MIAHGTLFLPVLSPRWLHPLTCLYYHLTAWETGVYCMDVKVILPRGLVYTVWMLKSYCMGEWSKSHCLGDLSKSYCLWEDWSTLYCLGDWSMSSCLGHWSKLYCLGSGQSYSAWGSGQSHTAWGTDAFCSHTLNNSLQRSKTLTAVQYTPVKHAVRPQNAPAPQAV